ncbi:MAG: hypothetical protein J0H74_24600 [Chitinophagaceae bacterium]|nr:hypothetical protein [Chitinophagaceae bacterium]
MKKIVLLLLPLGYFIPAGAQNLENIGKQKPFAFHGSLGASSGFYSSNEPIATRPPFAWSIYGNFTPSVYNVSLPFSFVVTQYSKSYTDPFAQFGISPTYKWIKVHLGYRNIAFSPMTFDGQSFFGAGLELNPKGFRFAAFYGRLNRKVNEDTTSGRFAQPQYSRIGYGVKIGVGNAANYFDLMYFHARDDSNSATVINKRYLRPQENTVLGSSFKLTILKRMTWTTDIALSGLTQDISLGSASTDSVHTGLNKFMGKLVRSNSSTVANYAGQTSLSLILRGYNTTLGYRRVEPDFKSLGTPYMLNDIELISWLNNFNLLAGKLNINTSMSNQHNDLERKLPSRMNTFVSTAGLNALFSPHFILNFNYSGYILRQKDGTSTLKDSTRLSQDIHQFTLTPVYTISKNSLMHSISASGNYMMLQDHNPATSPYTSSNNTSLSLNYTLGFTRAALNLTLSGIHNLYKQDTNSYSSNGVNLGVSKQLLKEQKLSLQGTVGYLFNKSSYGNARDNLTFSGNVSYRLKNHSLNGYANYIYTPYNPIVTIINKQTPSAVATKNFAGGISYNYSF